jgi:hypothetical protein
MPISATWKNTAASTPVKSGENSPTIAYAQSTREPNAADFFGETGDSPVTAGC